MLQAKVTLADFNLAVSTPTAKLPNLILCHIFRLYVIKIIVWVSGAVAIDNNDMVDRKLFILSLP